MAIDDFNTAMMELAKETIGCTMTCKSEWISQDTWRTIEERRQLKKKALDTKSPCLKERAVAQYRGKDKQVSSSARRDKRLFVERLARDAEAAAERMDMKIVYLITRKLRGNRGQNQYGTVTAKDGSTITEEKARLERWREHFLQRLNRCDPPTLADINEAKQDLDIELGPITVHEVKDAIKKLMNCIAPGDDNMHGDMLKA